MSFEQKSIHVIHSQSKEDRDSLAKFMATYFASCQVVYLYDHEDYEKSDGTTKTLHKNISELPCDLVVVPDIVSEKELNSICSKYPTISIKLKKFKVKDVKNVPDSLFDIKLVVDTEKSKARLSYNVDFTQFRDPSLQVCNITDTANTLAFHLRRSGIETIVINGKMGGKFNEL